MDFTFLAKWALSLVVGTGWVSITILIAEKIGGKLGGLISGLPATALVGLVFIGFTQDIEALRQTSLIMPLSSGFYNFFFIMYLLGSRRSFKLGLVLSLSTWLFFAYLAYQLNITSLGVSILIWAVLTPLCVAWTVKNIRVDSKKVPKKITPTQTWIKIVVSGAIISLIVLISKLAGPVWGGILATFPAVTLSTMFITIRSGGLEFTRLIAMNIMISTTTTIGLFAIFMYYFTPSLGIVPGAIGSYVLLLVISIPLYNLIFNKLKIGQ